MKLLFLAAGLGTRFQPVTHLWPKPTIPFLNVPMGLYHFRYLQDLKFSEFVVNTHHLPRKIEELYNNNPYCKITPRYSYEPIILGSAGALKKAFPEGTSNNEPILMMNADEIFFTKDITFLDQAVKQHEQNKALATLIVIKHPEAGKKFGAIWCDQQAVKNIGKENKDSNLFPWHYIGIIILHSRIIDLVKPDTELNIFYDILVNHLSKNEVQIFPIEAEWFETGNPTDFLKATESSFSKIDQLSEFINKYDNSYIYNDSLISKSCQNIPKSLNGFNVLSKTFHLKRDSLTNSVCFQDQIIGR